LGRAYGRIKVFELEPFPHERDTPYTGGLSACLNYAGEKTGMLVEFALSPGFSQLLE
jgi:hypothetical protein